MKELPKAYDPKQYENKVYERSEQSGFFGPQNNSAQDNVTSYFSMVLPPPNVTGTLHMGHAAMLAIEDVLARYHRMKGEAALWVPGTDHAAIATESKVEALLIKNEGFTKPKEELGRDAFLERVNQFAKDSHDTIVNQCKRMGASLDWSREAYTLDAVRSRAVRLVFKKMYDDGLIYRGYRVVNWSVKGQSTCSDDELVHVERPAKLYTFKYSHEFPIPIATTRPETKLGDTAVAVHPEGKWKQYIGQVFTVNNVGQAGHTLTIKVIGDAGVDDSFGTGALGVTPAHSMVDFDMYERCRLAADPIGLIQVIGEDGKMMRSGGAAYARLTIKEAQQKFVAYLKDQDLLIKEEDIAQNVGTSDRFKDVVEPLPKVQWFVDVNKPFEFKNKDLRIKGVTDGQMVSLKELMQTVVRNEQIKIIPDRFEKTYFHWIDNLRDWCISRQIWFGHQIPVYYCKQGNPKCAQPLVSVDEIVVCPQCGNALEQDPDTLDTWFSSGLWTFSTLLSKDSFENYSSLEEWLKNSPDFARFHPTSVLETGYDIIFFWVARMILMTTYAIGDVPFKTVYLHGLVRDEQGRKMSKTLDNIIDPLDMIAKFGADATRLSLLIGNGPGNDLKLSEEKIAGFRNFTNKLWNICRFMLLTIDNPKADIAEPTAKTLSDRWFLSQLSDTVKLVSTSLDQYQFSAAGELLRTFTWDQLADWYLEIAKIEGDKSDILNYALNSILKLWHPFMPFVTEAIWSEVYGTDQLLIVQKWPALEQLKQDAAVLDDFNLIRDIVVSVRALRAEYKVEPARKISVSISAKGKIALLSQEKSLIQNLRTGIATLTIESDIIKPDGAVGFAVGDVMVFANVSEGVDKAKEKERLSKEIAKVKPYVAAQQAKLANEDFTSHAPAKLVDSEKKKLAEAEQKLATLEADLARLS